MNRQDPPHRPDPVGVWGPAGHAVVSGALAAAGAAVATALGAPAPEVWVGASLAWAIQAAAVWRLQGALSARGPATRAWVGGMAARLAGLGVVAAAAGLTARDGAAMAVAYVATVIPLLWIEGLWLGRAAATGDRIGEVDARSHAGAETDGPTDGRSR